MMQITKLKTYSELLRFRSFQERFEYLNLHGQVGELTHGAYRYANQAFYTSREWRLFRNRIIERDKGCDLAIPELEILGSITVHHITPITVQMLEEHDPLLLDPENVICVSQITHEAIHYGSLETTPQVFESRKPNDTIPWK